MSGQIPETEIVANSGNVRKAAVLMREIRLGLVCYGGVSLAIYMHGVTKELYKLIRAARAFERAYEALAGQVPEDEDPDPWLAGPAKEQAQSADRYDSERAYFAALAALAARGVPLTVTLDVIAGTSAGGINGVCLARSLAEGRSLDGFRNLWLEHAGIKELLAGHALFPWGPLKLWSKLAESAIRLAWHQDAGVLNGDLMSRLLYQALDGMERDGDPLIPADESLDLFVTTTNVYGYDTVIPTGAGGISHTDKSYRQLLRFHYDKQPPGQVVARFSADFSDVPALAFAARATASFPGAFPPVSLGTFLGALDRLGVEPSQDTIRQIARHFVYGLEYGATDTGQWFMDGGILDNGPFDHVIDAIAAKRANGATAREIIYIEPDPGPPPEPGPRAPDPEPTFVKTIWAARMTIPHHTPLVGVLGQLAAMNAAISEVGAIVEAQEPDVLRLLDDDQLRGAVGYATVTAGAEQVRTMAQQLAGPLGYATYGRLRAQAVAEAFATNLAAALGFPAESNRASFMAAAFGAWARQQKAWREDAPDALEAQLGAIDIPFRVRRAEFVLQGINELFADADPGRRSELATMKSKCWDLITELRSVQQRVAVEILDQAMALFGPQALTQEGYLADPAAFAGTGPGGHDADLRRLYQACVQAVGQAGGVTGSSQGLWETLTGQTQAWDSKVRAKLLARYVGFPIWDALIFPVISLARLPQLKQIGVQRFSPLDATCLKAVDGDGKLKTDPCAKLDGTAISHFGAFFKRTWRENDYLWGRLDGAELALRLLGRQSGRPDGESAADLTGPLRSALRAILNAEQADLTQIGRVCQALAAQVEDIETMKPDGPGV
jgi:patatin-related protein